MSAGGSSVDNAAPNLNLTPDEKRVYGQLFRQADTDNVGVVTGEIAVKFFEKTRLDSRILGEIWQIADSENRGFLTPAGFSIVLRLIGFAQNGREPTTQLASQPGPLPQFDGLQLPGVSSPTAPAAQALQAQGTGGGPVRIPALTPDKVNQYAGLFERQALQPNGHLPGDQAKSIFEKSGLPNEALGRIWQLADTEQRGALVQTEFVIAMHLLTSMKSGALRGLPTILPAPLYEAATRRGAAPRQSPSSTGAPSAIPRQMSGNQSIRTGSPLGRPPITAQPQSAATPAEGTWLVAPADKTRFDMLYDDLDKGRKGFITGEEAVPFLSQSNLPEDALAQIWDLADINSEGRLNRDTFAVAMYLIRQQRTKKDGSGPPQALPASLIPPSMRQARQQTGSSPFDAPPQQPQQPPAPAAPSSAPKSAMEDLFGLDDSSSSTPAQAQTAQTTGGSAANDPFTGGPRPPTSPARPSPTTTQFKPFVPSSSFGRGLTAQATGDSTGSGPGPSKPAMTSEDLLGDNDPEVSKKLTNETTELGNLSNQVGSLSKQMQEVQGQRTTTQNEFNQASSQKKNFEQRLAQLRTLYEKEAADLHALQEQLSTTRKETQKLQSECMTLDTTYRDLHTQHQQVVAGLEADRQENASLKDKIRAVNAEIAQLKPQIEKLRSEARQQKGLVAINKKQLSTNEGERDKLQSEAGELAKGGGAEALSRQDTGSSAPGSGSVVSPAASVASGNNPFFKRTGSTDIMGAFASPSIKAPAGEQSFDDIFGPSGSAGTSAATPPIAPFKPQNTGTSTGSAGSYATPPANSPNVSRQTTFSSEPPAPPESRQINSSFLPFPDAPESLSSSRAVSPPASRDGRSQDPAMTPTQTAPGAFPTDLTVENTSDQETTNSGAFADTVKDDDPFGTVDQDKAKADFDDAFASFTKARKSPQPTDAEGSQFRSAFDSEFPPISELEGDDDDSDTASEGGGFDDDFAPASETQKQSDPLAASGGKATTKELPAQEAESEQTEKRNDAASPVHALGDSSAAATGADELFGGDAAVDTPQPPQPISQTPQSTNPPALGKASFDEVDDDFEGLEDAKEGSADDDFQTISRSGFEDFNPVFDSGTSQDQVQSESATAPFGQQSSYDFANVSQPSASTGVADIAEKGKESESHDWDAIFASLDSPSAPTAAAPAPAPAATEETAEPRAEPAAASAEGKEDDPILKNLTSMGYSREDSLLALEKYDYNLERAANHLANQS